MNEFASGKDQSTLDLAQPSREFESYSKCNKKPLKA